MARALHNSTPYSRPHLILGKVTRKKVCRPEAPSEIAASSSCVPCSCISGISARATNGNVTKVVASAMPGTANSTWILCACIRGPKNPCAPNSSTKIRPDITGLTENGRSISEISTVLPKNSNLVIAHPAITPNTRLRLTEITATVSVSRIAESASGSVSALKYAPTPFENACANTTTKGSTTKTVRKVTVIAMMTARTSHGSVRVSARADSDNCVFAICITQPPSLRDAHPNSGFPEFGCADPESRDSGFAPLGRALRGPVVAPRNDDLCVACAFSKPSSMRRDAGLRPALDAVDREDDQERRDQHDDGNRGGVGVAKFG